MTNTTGDFALSFNLARNWTDVWAVITDWDDCSWVAVRPALLLMTSNSESLCY